MRAARIHQYGEPDVFVVEEVERPEPGPGDLLVRIEAASVNPIDWKIRCGSQRAFIRYDLPWILGLDVSGVVEAVGDEVEGWEVGDALFASTDYRRPGAYAEYMLVAAEIAARKPDGVSHAEAASVPLVGLTAWQSLVEKGRVSEGDRVFIQAGSGGVGSFAVQLCKARGAIVTTTCSTRNVEWVRELGADRVIDYTREDYTEIVREQDVVFDTLGGDDRWDSLQCVKRGGRHVSIVSDIPPHVTRHGPYLGVVVAGSKLGGFALYALASRLVRASLVVQMPDAKQLARIAELMKEGKIEAQIDREYSLDEVAEAHRHSESKRAQGKIVVRP